MYAGPEHHTQATKKTADAVNACDLPLDTSSAQSAVKDVTPDHFEMQAAAKSAEWLIENALNEDGIKYTVWQDNSVIPLAYINIHPLASGLIFIEVHYKRAGQFYTFERFGDVQFCAALMQTAFTADELTAAVDYWLETCSQSDPEAEQGDPFDRMIKPRQYNGPKAYDYTDHLLYRASTRRNRLTAHDFVELSQLGWF